MGPHTRRAGRNGRKSRPLQVGQWQVYQARELVLGAPLSAVGSEPSARGPIDLEVAPLAAVWLPGRQMPQQQHRHM